MRRWMKFGVVACIAWIGLGATCVGQDGMREQINADAGTSVPAADDAYDDGFAEPDENTSPDRPHGTVTSGLDITTFRSVIFRVDGSQDDVGDEELFLAAGNRAVMYLTVTNQSGGWVPINFELCIDHADVLVALDPTVEPPETGAVLEEPCAVRFRDGEWPIIEQAQDLEFRGGAIEAKPQAGGGYMTMYFRADFLDAGVLDLFEFTIPYRVLPPNEKAAWVPRKVTKRRLTIELP